MLPGCCQPEELFILAATKEGNDDYCVVLYKK
jgi:hypothetical protein